MPLYRVAETLRPEPGLFDVAIIDEASQSGPEALFLHYIAERIVVVGDDKQISPDNVGLNRENVFALRERHLRGIPQADSLGMDHSYFDVADIRFGGRITLREHFRCMPEIIRFSNEQFYDGRLVPLRQYGFDRLPPLRAVHVADGYERGDENPPEAEAIVERILACCADPAYAGRTMGVVSLRGARQAQKIESLLLAAMDAGRIEPGEFEERRIVCGDAYAFQGDDRDVMFLSMVTAARDDRRIAARTDAATQRRFNVAASRARDQMWLFHSVSAADLGPTDLRGALLRAVVEPAAMPMPPASDGEPFESGFEREVCRRIRARGYRVTPQVRVGPYRIDLVVEGAGARLAIECDGDRWHGPEQFDRDQARQRVLERSGWVFWRVRGGAFYLDPEEALSDLWPLLGRLGIAPAGGLPAVAGGAHHLTTWLPGLEGVKEPDATATERESG
jgi:very-short-patch-repair endonuclease